MNFFCFLWFFIIQFIIFAQNYLSRKLKHHPCDDTTAAYEETTAIANPANTFHNNRLCATYY